MPFLILWEPTDPLAVLDCLTEKIIYIDLPLIEKQKTMKNEPMDEKTCDDCMKSLSVKSVIMGTI